VILDVLKSITDLHMVTKEMTCLYELAEFLLVSDLQTSAICIPRWRVHDTDIDKHQHRRKEYSTTAKCYHKIS
jgi:hypothetical protein